MLTLTCPHCHETDSVEPISITGFVICGNCDNEFEIDLFDQFDQDDAMPQWEQDELETPAIDADLPDIGEPVNMDMFETA